MDLGWVFAFGTGLATVLTISANSKPRIGFPLLDVCTTRGWIAGTKSSSNGWPPLKLPGSPVAASQEMILLPHANNNCSPASSSDCGTITPAGGANAPLPICL